LNPAIYGPYAEEFNPERWITAETAAGSKKEDRALIQPAKASFLAWSYGPRSCPGTKMAQVEFVAVMFGILKRYRVVPAIRHQGQTLREAREKLQDCMADSRQRITLMMNRPQDVWLSFEKR
jgi:cytochrome P450